MKYASAPRKLSALNHLSDCLFKRLKKLKAEKFRGVHMFSTKVVDCLCKAYRLCVKQNTGDPQRANAQILNAIKHYWGNHANCREYDVEDENGENNIWCGFQREGEKYKFFAHFSPNALSRCRRTQHLWTPQRPSASTAHEPPRRTARIQFSRAARPAARVLKCESRLLPEYESLPTSPEPVKLESKILLTRTGRRLLIKCS